MSSTSNPLKISRPKATAAVRMQGGSLTGSKKILALIPARGGSKDIFRKNIVPILGHPLLAYSIAAAKLSRLVNRIVVSTDDEEIANIARLYGAEVPFLRPTKLAQDHSLDIEFFNHALDWLYTHEKYVPDHIIHLRPTVPSREPGLIDNTFKIILADPKATSLRTSHEAPFTAFKLFRMDGKYAVFFGNELFPKKVEFFNFPRQKLPKTYHINGSVDIIVTKHFKGTGMLHGTRMRPYFMEPVPDIDLPEDIPKTEKELKKKKYKPLRDYLEKFKRKK